MQAMDAYALAGALSLIVLALLHGIVWRAKGARSSAYFALSFAAGALLYLFDGRLQPTGDRPHAVAAVLAAGTLMLLTLGMVSYVGLAGAAARRLRLLALGVAPVVVALLALGVLQRLAAFVAIGAYILVNAILAAWAMRREPGRGHGIVFLALLLFPLTVLAAVAGWVPMPMLRYLVIAPVAITGAALLTIGLLRAQAEAEAEIELRRQAEESLRTLNESLEQHVALRTAELHDVVLGLESFNRSVSHDLRGPLGGIAALSRLAAEALDAGDTARARHMLGAISKQADASADLVASLLALARVGDTALAPQRVELRPLVHEALDTLRLAEPGRAAVQVVVQPLPVVEADPGLLRQVYLNLIGNAVKFTSDAGAPRIEVGAADTGSGAVLFVRDNGIGFDAAEADALFEPFRRLHGLRYEGHGVGLSIVKRIVERHGGRLWAESSPGQGATFYFTLQRDA